MTFFGFEGGIARDRGGFVRGATGRYLLGGTQRDRHSGFPELLVLTWTRLPILIYSFPLQVVANTETNATEQWGPVMPSPRTGVCPLSLFPLLWTPILPVYQSSLYLTPRFSELSAPCFERIQPDGCSGLFLSLSLSPLTSLTPDKRPHDGRSPSSDWSVTTLDGASSRIISEFERCGDGSLA